ncbi:MAG: 4-hydroxybenzoate octaprenyltransferase [Planctomycetes bacterium]|nr:4-hydroxybenzoate octaprenyltransferase [Planctomycetota bacterium]
MATAAPTPLRTAGVIAADIKLHHSVFALPFAVLAAFMAAPGSFQGAAAIVWPRFSGQLALVVVAMVFARTVAMLANRLLDRHIDKDNPRTTARALPSGRLSVKAALAVLCSSATGFMAVCLAFGVLYGNWWPAGLGLPVLAWLSLYPLLKRFTSLSHLYLGSSLAISPLAAALAVQPQALVQQPALWLLAGMVLCWVAGFDIIYALQDVEIDRQQGLFSMPMKLGPGGAMWVSRGLHAAAVVCLIAAAWLDPRFAWLFSIGVAVMFGLLTYEHLTVGRWGTTKIALAFFTLNGVISCLLGALGVADILA